MAKQANQPPLHKGYTRNVVPAPGYESGLPAAQLTSTGRKVKVQGPPAGGKVHRTKGGSSGGQRGER